MARRATLHMTTMEPLEHVKLLQKDVVDLKGLFKALGADLAFPHEGVPLQFQDSFLPYLLAIQTHSAELQRGCVMFCALYHGDMTAESQAVWDRPVGHYRSYPLKGAALLAGLERATNNVVAQLKSLDIWRVTTSLEDVALTAMYQAIDALLDALSDYHSFLEAVGNQVVGWQTVSHAKSKAVKPQDPATHAPRADKPVPGPSRGTKGVPKPAPGELTDANSKRTTPPPSQQRQGAVPNCKPGTANPKAPSKPAGFHTGMAGTGAQQPVAGKRATAGAATKQLVSDAHAKRQPMGNSTNLVGVGANSQNRQTTKPKPAATNGKKSVQR